MYKSILVLFGLLLLGTEFVHSQIVSKAFVQNTLRGVDADKMIQTPANAASRYSNKLDPLLRYVFSQAEEYDFESTALMEKFSSVYMPISLELEANGAVLAPVFVKSDDIVSTTNSIKAYGGYVTTVTGDILVSHVPITYLENLSQRDEIRYLGAGSNSGPKLNVSSVEIQATEVHAGTGLPQSYKGSGVVVGVVDSGIDWSHEDFDDGNGTRIQYLWDMSGTGNPPPGYTYGVEYTKTQIDANQCQEIDGNDGHGHGTHVSATAAGKDNALAGYTGIASEADIVFVKGFRNGPGFANTDVVDGCSYIFTKAMAMGQPCVINLSLGGHFGAHDGTSLYEQSLSNLTGPGRVIVAAAGNEGSDLVHLSYTTGGSANEVRQTFWYIPPGTPMSAVDMWYDSGNISVGIAAYDQNLNYIGRTSPLPPGQFFQDLPFTIGGQTYGIVSIDAQTVNDPNNGAHRVLFIIDSDNGQYDLNAVWWVLYTFGNGTFDAWMVTGGNFTTDSNPANHVMPGDNDKSIGIPGTSEKVICVGSYVTKTQWIDIDGNTQTQPGNPTIGDISSFSSRGPTRDNRLKPDLAAPGEAILAALSSFVTIGGNGIPRANILQGGRHQKMQGTSMASPHVTGTVALMLQRNPGLDYTRVFDILTTTTVKDNFTGTNANNTFGNGKLNALNAVQNTPDGGGSGTPVEAGKLIAGDGAPDEYFGNAVAVSGDYVVVGAHFDDDNGWGSGSAYIFHWNGTSWVQQAKLIGSNTSSYDFFGSSVSIDGETAIIGAPGDAVGGAAYVFHRTASNWSQEAILTASDAASGDNFGSSVSISGDTVLVGAPGDYFSTGAAYIFKRNGGSWTELTRLTANDGVAFDYFGSSVAIEGDVAIAGAKDHYANGAVYVFGVDGNSWELEGQLTASDGSSGDKFGASVSLSGNTIVVGARFDDDNGLDSGSAYVFRKQGNTWNQEAKLTPIDGGADDRFGMVSVKGDVVLVGATHDDDNGLDAGTAYVFTHSGSGWSQLAKVLPGDGHAGDWFGSSVALGYHHFLVGSPYDNDNGSDSGSAYVFDFTVTAIRDGLNPFTTIPGEFVLFQNYPNPFNPSTTIRYQLPRSSEVVLDIYNLLGQKIASLVDGWQAAGEYRVQWNGRSERGAVVSSGIYLYRLKVDGGSVKSRRMILLK